MSVTVVLSISFDRDVSQFCNLIFMNSSPDNQHLFVNKKRKVFEILEHLPYAKCTK